MSEFFPEPKSLGKVKFELDLPYYPTKTNWKNATGLDAPHFC